MKAFQAPTLTKLHRGMIDRMVNAPYEEFSVKTGGDYQFHDVVGIAKTMEFEDDLKYYWLEKSRWSRIVRDYLDIHEIEKWEYMAIDKRERLVVLPTKKVHGYKNQGSSWRHLGGCLLGVGFQGAPKPRMILWSRTSYLGYLSILDLAVPYVLLKRLNVPPEMTSLTWVVGTLQFAWIKSPGYMIHRYPEEMLEGKNLDAPLLQKSYNELEKIRKMDNEDMPYSAMKFNPQRRIRRRYHTEVFGPDYGRPFESIKYYKTGTEVPYRIYPPLPSVSVNELNLESIESGGKK